MSLLEDAKSVYNALEDDISRTLFEARWNYILTGDAGYITLLPAEYRSLNADIEIYRQRLLERNQRRTVIYGAGFNGQHIAAELLKNNVFAFIDNHRKERLDTATQIPIYPFEPFVSEFGIRDTKFIISVNDRNTAALMQKQLLECGVLDKDIVVSTPDYRNNSSQYFDLFVPGEHESFVDCGCYDGSTAFRFAGWCGEKSYDKIWCFEPDQKSYEKCRKICQKLENCQVFPYGVSDRAGTVYFTTSGREDARIVQSGTNEGKVEVVKLDEFLRGEKVSFIKMDIEGAEYDAIKGSEQIIREQKPKLAVSIYHKKDDFIVIPESVLKIRPDYKIYMRHYSLLINETVLFAI